MTSQARKILSLDTCNGMCSVAITDGHNLHQFALESEPSRQAEKLIIMTEQILTQSHMQYSDLDAIAINIGPGSFTGVRIGIAAAKGLHLASSVPIIGINGFEIMAINNNETGTCVVAFDARREQIYLQTFANQQPISEPLLVSIEQAALSAPMQEFTLVGNGANLMIEQLTRLGKKFTTASTTPIDANLVSNAAQILYLKRISNTSINPLYIRQADAKPLKP